MTKPVKKQVNKATDLKARVLGKKELPKGPITESNIGEQREKTLESAKKFKYPLQQAKHRVLITAAIVFVVAAVAFVSVSWWMLYTKQDISDFYYAATRILPVPVAEVDGQPVSYGDYMRRLRADVNYLEKQENRDFSTEDGQRELEHIRRVDMDETEKAAYAAKIAKEKSISVSDEEVQTSIDKILSGQGGAISERAFENSIWRYYGWSMGDYRSVTQERLLLRKVSFAVDDAARKKASEVKNQLDFGGDFGKLAKKYSDDEDTKAKGGDAGTVNVSDDDSDGLIAAAKKLKKGQVSDLIEGIDAFYIIKLTGKSDTTVKYSLIKISLGEFDRKFEALREQGKIHEYIEIKEDK
ncbi:MAG: SurA N-terminal domain-containing protein [Candidatus Nomurabacteria bacterium]|jgi:hypothetical protein|nr:SurA N-terminal domain-containing protein [Candidatus Nomurabacteria bacterium]